MNRALPRRRLRRPTGPRRPGRAPRTRLTAALCGLAAAAALALPGAGAAAAPSQPPSAAKIPAATAAGAASALEALDVPGTAWGVDGATGRLHVAVSSATGAEGLAEVRRTAARYGAAVSVERLDGPLRTLLAGGDAVTTGSARCSVGVNVQSGSTYYFITAGHCTQGTTTWSSGTTPVGATAGTSFPVNDYGLVRYTNPAVPHPGTIGTVDATGPGSPYVGQRVCRRGSTTGVRCGTITALNQTVNWGGGDIVYGLIRTDICAEPGDSGGPLYDPSTGRVLGILVGGSGNCTSGGTTFYQPIQEALSAYGVSIY